MADILVVIFHRAFRSGCTLYSPVPPSSACPMSPHNVGVHMCRLRLGREHRTVHSEAPRPGGWLWAELLPLGTENSCLGQGAGRAGVHGHAEQSVV